MAAPPFYLIDGRHRLLRNEDSSLHDSTADTRGLVLLYEPPNPRARYVMGVDATQGRTGWSRYSTTENDTDIDNGAIEILRIGRGEPGAPNFVPDTQVAEYAAPIDPYDLARVANTLGRLYGGSNEDGQAHCIAEVWPGPGGPLQRELQDRYGYTNLYMTQYLDTGEQAAKQGQFGWYSNKQTMQHLWTKGLREIHRNRVLFRSIHLVEEFANCEMDLVRLRGAAAGTGHDDRVTACLLAIWAMRGYSFGGETRASRVESGPVVNWQASDISAERMQDEWQKRFEEISAEAEEEYS